MGTPSKKPRQNGINAWKHKVGKPKKTRRNPLRSALSHERRVLPLVFSLRHLPAEKLSPDTISDMVEKMQGINAYKRMGRFALANLRAYLLKHSIKDFTR